MHQRRASIKAVMVTTTSTSAIQIACRSCRHFQRRCVCPTVVEFVGVNVDRTWTVVVMRISYVHDGCTFDRRCLVTTVLLLTVMVLVN